MKKHQITAQDVPGVRGQIRYKEAGDNPFPCDCHDGNLIKTHSFPTAVLNLHKKGGHRKTPGGVFESVSD